MMITNPIIKLEEEGYLNIGNCHDKQNVKIHL